MCSSVYLYANYEDDGADDDGDDAGDGVDEDNDITVIWKPDAAAP